MWVAIDDLHAGLWNQLVRSTQQQGGPELPDAAFFETADTRWQSLKPALQTAVAPGTPAPFRTSVEAYLRDWGPHPEALYAIGQGCLPVYQADLPALEGWVGIQQKLYPADPRTHENAARLALEQEDYARAVTAAERGLALAKKHSGLRLVWLEAQAAQGHVPQAEEAARLARQADPTAAAELALIRGLAHSGQRFEAVERIRTRVQRDGKPAWILQQLASFPATALLLAPGAAPIPELARVPAGVEGLLQAAVERHLGADAARATLGEPPGEKGQNAREFVGLQPGELLLFFYDWSLWHNAKAGLALDFAPAGLAVCLGKPIRNQSARHPDRPGSRGGLRPENRQSSHRCGRPRPDRLAGTGLARDGRNPGGEAATTEMNRGFR